MTISKEQAVEMFGSRQALADALGISIQAVGQWRDDRIPEKQAMRIRYELKPELFSVGSEQPLRGTA